MIPAVAFILENYLQFTRPMEEETLNKPFGSALSLTFNTNNLNLNILHDKLIVNLGKGVYYEFSKKDGAYYRQINEEVRLITGIFSMCYVYLSTATKTSRSYYSPSRHSLLYATDF
jgi:hypothetical protein